MIGAPFLVLGLLLVLSALVGARVRGRDRGAVGAFLLSPLHPATWYASLAIFLGFWVELFAFGLAVAAFSSGVSLLFVGIGFVVIGLTVEGCRLVARVERRRARLADPRPLLPHPYRPYGTGIRDLVLAVFVDINRWRDVVYVLVAFPLTVLEFVVIAVLWSASLALLSLPLLFVTAGLPAGFGAGAPVSPAAIAIACGLIGLVLLPVAATVSQGLMSAPSRGRRRPALRVGAAARSNGASRRWRTAAGRSSTWRRPSCAGSSGTSTTAPSSGSSC